jgi:hypothetical protein
MIGADASAVSCRQRSLGRVRAWAAVVALAKQVEEACEGSFREQRIEPQWSHSIPLQLCGGSTRIRDGCSGLVASL